MKNKSFPRAALAGLMIVMVVSSGIALAAHPFTDVPTGKYYSEAVDWAYGTGLTTGTTATTFSPDASVTRGQNITFAWRYDDLIVQPALADRYTKTQADDAVEAALPKFAAVTATGDSLDSTMSTTYAAVPQMTTTISTTAGQRLLITFSASTNCVQNPLSSAYCYVRVLIDGTPVGDITAIGEGGHVVDSAQRVATTSAAGYASTSTQFVSDVLDAGAHTITAEYRVDETNTTFNVMRGRGRVLSVIAS